MTRILVLPLALLLFLQWPLREWVQAYSREVNDAGQVLFSLYVSVAISEASRSGSHLAVGSLLSPGSSASRWKAWALLACVGPWAAFTLWAASGQIYTSVIGLEHFPETFSPGYFLIKLSLGLLLILIVMDSVRAVVASKSTQCL